MVSRTMLAILANSDMRLVRVMADLSGSIQKCGFNIKHAIRYPAAILVGVLFTSSEILES